MEDQYVSAGSFVFTLASLGRNIFFVPCRSFTFLELVFKTVLRDGYSVTK